MFVKSVPRVNILRHIIYNMGEKPSAQRERFFNTMFANCVPVWKRIENPKMFFWTSKIQF